MITAKQLSPAAKHRLAFIEFYKTVRSVTVVCQSFKISRQTFYKWYRRYRRDGRLLCLENQPKTPISRRQPAITLEQETNIKQLRRQYPVLGKIKLAKLYQQDYGQTISSWQIQRTIQKYRLYFDQTRAQKIRTKKHKTRGNRKIRISEVNPQTIVSADKPFFFCTDTIVLYLPWGQKRYILTAIDYFHKIGFARVYKTKSSLSAFDFLLRLNMLADGKIAATLSDNGSEFAKYFEAACRKLKIMHIYTRVKTPKDNSVNERFNRTVQEEFMAVNQDFETLLANDDLTAANRELTDWLLFYNGRRPHQTLDYQTPLGYTFSCLQLSAMSPSHTHACYFNLFLIQSTEVC